MKRRFGRYAADMQGTCYGSVADTRRIRSWCAADMRQLPIGSDESARERIAEAGVADARRVSSLHTACTHWACIVFTADAQRIQQTFTQQIQRTRSGYSGHSGHSGHAAGTAGTQRTRRTQRTRSGHGGHAAGAGAPGAHTWRTNTGLTLARMTVFVAAFIAFRSAIAMACACALAADLRRDLGSSSSSMSAFLRLRAGVETPGFLSHRGSGGASVSTHVRA